MVPQGSLSSLHNKWCFGNWLSGRQLPTPFMCYSKIIKCEAWWLESRLQIFYMPYFEVLLFDHIYTNLQDTGRYNQFYISIINPTQKKSFGLSIKSLKIVASPIL